MNNFELIDNYLTNRLGEDEKAAFEKQLVSDSSLKTDVEFQKGILEAVKKARANELKAMLQKVPVGGTASFDFPVLRMAAAIVGAGILLTGLTLYFKSGKAPNMTTSMEDSVNKKIDSNDFEPLEEPTTKAIESKSEKSDDEQKVKPENLTKDTPKSPTIEVTNPTNETIQDSEKEKSHLEGNKTSTTSTLEVVLDSSNKKYSFHYQFNNGKLLLYGAFDKSLYEILDINGDKQAIFIFYKNAYYAIDPKQENITLLEPIKDNMLIGKLNAYRKK
jgi:hypothetical protein